MKKVNTYIYEKKHRSGNVSFVVRYKDSASKWVSVSAGTSKDEALVVEAKIRQELFSGIDPKGNIEKKRADVSISQVVDHYRKQLRFKGLSEKWRDTVDRFFDGRVKPQLGGVNLSTLKREQVLKLYQSIIQDGCSSATLVKYHHQLNTAIRSYCETHAGLSNPVEKIKIAEIAPRQNTTREINFLTPEEIEQLLRQIETSSSKLLLPLVQFLAFTGMRRSEALELKWTDVDLNTGFFIIRKSKTQRPRSVPIESRAISAIEALRGRGEFVFCYEDGSRPDEASFLRALKRQAKKAGITKRIDLHTLRHSYGSNKIRAGWGIKKVSKILGHTDIQTTANIYSHLLDGDLKVQDELLFDNPLKEAHHEKGFADFSLLLKALGNLQNLGVQELNALLELKTREMHESQLQSVEAGSAPHMLRKGFGALPGIRGKMGSGDGERKQMSGQIAEFTKEKRPDLKDQACLKMVEVNGFEPMTPCLQSRCSTN
jgi:integrase